jgi:hypothetical protein
MRLRKNGDAWRGICSIAILLTLMTGAATAEEREALSPSMSQSIRASGTETLIPG